MYSFQRETFKFQDETRAQIQDLTNQINEYISSQSRLETKEEEARLVDELTFQTAIDEEDEKITASDSYLGKGEDVLE